MRKIIMLLALAPMVVVSRARADYECQRRCNQAGVNYTKCMNVCENASEPRPATPAFTAGATPRPQTYELGGGQ